MIEQKFVLSAINGELLSGPEDSKFISVSTDSRRLKEGQLFFALKGQNFNGHDFINDAIAKGAAGIVAEYVPENLVRNENTAIIRTDSTLSALGDLSKSWRRKFRKLKVVCITGSNGKTTTKEMTYNILSIKYNVLKNQGNLNNEIGVPLTLLNLDREHDVCVVEMGMNDFGEIRKLASIAEPDIATITNVGRAHLEKLGDLSGVARAKGEIVENLGSNATFVVNGDDPYVRKIADRTGCRKISYGITEKDSDITAEDIMTEGLESINFKMRIKGRGFSLRIKGIGRHNVMNALCASAIALSLGCTDKEIQAGLERFTPAYMRLEVFDSPQGFKIINDTYNANPDSVTRALEELSSLKDGNRTIAILGDMLELGTNSSSEHRKIGELINSFSIDYVICLGDHAKCIKAGIKNKDRVSHVSTHSEAARLVNSVARPGDLILIKGSRGMKMEKIIQNLY